MARNGSGTYVLPAGNPVTTGTTISSTWANTTLSDISSALTTSISTDGQTTPSANLPMGGFAHTGVANATVRTQYASAAQVQDGALEYLGSVSGTDTITASAAVGMTAYTVGQTFRFVAAGANTTTAVTININGIGAKNITKNGATALAIGDISSGAALQIVYDGTQFQVTGIAGVASFSAGSTGLTPSTATNGAVTLAGILSVANGGTGTATGGNLWRNRIINGGMNVWQRGTSSSASGYGTADRWSQTVVGTTTFSQETSVIPTGSQYALKWTTGASSSYGQIRQFIETANLYDLRGQTVFASAQVRCNATFTGNLQFEIGYATTSDSSLATYTIISGTTTGTVNSSGYTQITWTGTVPSNALGLYVGIIPAVAQASGAIAYIGQVQLEKGSTATSFEYRPYGTELALCQRYYEKSYDISVVPGTTGATFGAIEFTTGIAGSAAGSVAGLSTRFATAKRAAPTMTAYDTISGTINTLNGLVNTGARSGTVTPTIVSNTNQFNIDVTVGTSLAGFYGQWTASAEL